MKFVHLTTQSNISKIKANGLKLGNGRKGKGLYAMPLLSLKHVCFDNKTIVDRSSQLFWKWLIKVREKYGKRQGKTVAIIFRLQEHHWPLTVFIDLPKEQAEKFIPALPEPDDKLFSYDTIIKTNIRYW